MLNIPASFKNNNEDYITLPAIINFMKKHKIKGTSRGTREELLDKIIEYGNNNDTNANYVIEWIDYVIQEGIKDVYLKFAILSDDIELITKDETKLNSYLKNFIAKDFSAHICSNKYGSEFELINAYVENSKMGRKIIFIYCKNLYVYNNSKDKSIVKKVIYPVIAEYYIDSQWLLVKAKPKSNLYNWSEEKFDIEKTVSTTTEKQIFEVIELVEKILHINRGDRDTNSNNLKNRIFKLLKKYTTTPKEIVDIMSNENEQILNISTLICNICSVSDKCQLPIGAEKDIDNDIRNIIEKYLSINWNEKEIFIEDREAYPIKISATDEEESKVEQTAALFEPLQTKALFFDNKKMLYKNESCDGITFKWKRINCNYGQRDKFAVKIFVNQKGMCIFKFNEYTEKEDIENVIFSIIGTSEHAC